MSTEIEQRLERALAAYANTLDVADRRELAAGGGIRRSARWGVPVAVAASSAVVVGIAVVLVTGSSGDGGPASPTLTTELPTRTGDPAPPVPTTPPTTPMSTTPMPPAEFTDRTALPTCPAVVLGQVEQVPPAAQACLDAGRVNGEGAELSVTFPTEEGDPVVTYYRVLPGVPGYEYFADATRDRFGSQVWARVSCPEATTITDPGDCTYTDLG